MSGSKSGSGSGPADAAPATCPRCRSAATGVRARSPADGVWTIFGCDTCFYTWRSTEPQENTRADSYPAVFRLKPEDLPGFPRIPAVPPRRP